MYCLNTAITCKKIIACYYVLTYIEHHKVCSKRSQGCDSIYPVCQIFTTHRNEPSRSTVSTYEQKRTRQSLMLNTINNMPRTVQWKSILASLFSMWNVSNGCFSDRPSHDIKKQSILFRKKKIKDNFLFGNDEIELVLLDGVHLMKHASNIFQFHLLQCHRNECNLQCFQFRDAMLPQHGP